MLIDTHCHLNMMVKKEFDVPITSSQIAAASAPLNDALQAGVSRIINVGTSLVESKNSVQLAQHYPNVYAAVGIHPNDCTSTWRDDVKEIAKLAQRHSEHKIVAIGECGLDCHYPDYNDATTKRCL